MTVIYRTPLAFLIGCAVLGAVAAHADDRLNSHPWDFKVRGGAAATARASIMWQAEQSGGAGGLSAAGLASGGGLAGLPSVGSVANMNLITVMVGDNSVVDVAVEADQQNTGALSATATAVTAVGDMVDVGRVGSAPNMTQSGSQP